MAIRRGTPTRTLSAVLVIIFSCFINVVEGYDSWYYSIRIIRIVAPILILIALCAGGGYCCKKRRNQAQMAAAVPQDPENQLPPPYTISVNDPQGPGYTSQHNNLAFSYGNPEGKSLEHSEADYTKPPPAYEEVIRQKNDVPPS